MTSLDPSPYATLKAEKTTLRRQLKQQRRHLTAKQQQHAAQALARQFNTSPWRLRAKSLAAYLPHQGEISPDEIMQAAAQLGCSCYVPVLHPIYKNRLAFCQLTAQSKLKRNRFGIKEPDFRYAARRNPRFISVVLTPLVGFDHKANRLGMGGGFYDRSFEFVKRWKAASDIPIQVGLGHHCQKVSQIPLEPWDLPLNGIISDTETIIGQG